MKIVSLSFKTLEAAKKMLNEVFPVQKADERTDFWLPASLDESYKKASPYRDCIWVKYWVAIEKEKLIGIIGLYSLKSDAKEACWLSWFCVYPDYRGKGFGGKLLDFAIKKAKQKGKKFLRLYTSPNDPNEAEAQKLYEKKGFVVTGEGEKRGKYNIVYRELKLK